MWKRWVLSFVLKVVKHCVFLTDSGSEFQTVDPKTEKDVLVVSEVFHQNHTRYCCFGNLWRCLKGNHLRDLVPITLMKRPSSKPSPRNNGSSNTQTPTSLATSTNWTDQSRLFCSGWELGATDSLPTWTASSRFVSLRCAHTMQTSWLQNTYYSTANYMMLWGKTRGQNQYHWGSSSLATCS